MRLHDKKLKHTQATTVGKQICATSKAIMEKNPFCKAAKHRDNMVNTLQYNMKTKAVILMVAK